MRRVNRLQNACHSVDGDWRRSVHIRRKHIFDDDDDDDDCDDYDYDDDDCDDYDYHDNIACIKVNNPFYHNLWRDMYELTFSTIKFD